MAKINQDSVSKDMASIFKKYKVAYEWYLVGNDIRISIEWGDWKHDHYLIDYAMKEKGYTKVGETMTEEDGSDCYSSVHRYIKL